MTAPTAQSAFEQAFINARTFNRFSDRPVSDETLKELYDLVKWGPTSMNCQPARYVFARSPEAKAKLGEALMPGNMEKTMAAPVTVIVATDPKFYDKLPTMFPVNPGARDMFANNAALSEISAFRNGTLQGGYLIVAARMLGLDCGPMSGFNNAKVDELFFADSGWKSNFLINIGYGDVAGNYPRGPRLDFDEAAVIL
jgi:3-hydroxypropanoate dehydrogenase